MFGVLIAIMVVCALPACLVLVSGALAGLLGCTLDEGSVHVCRIAGTDVGELLYMGFVFGWLMLLTAPPLLLCGIVWFGIGLRVLWRRFGT